MRFFFDDFSCYLIFILILIFCDISLFLVVIVQQTLPKNSCIFQSCCIAIMHFSFCLSYHIHTYHVHIVLPHQYHHITPPSHHRTNIITTSHHTTCQPRAAWRVVLCVGALPCVAVAYHRFHLRETKREQYLKWHRPEKGTLRSGMWKVRAALIGTARMWKKGIVNDSVVNVNCFFL